MKILCILFLLGRLGAICLAASDDDFDSCTHEIKALCANSNESNGKSCNSLMSGSGSHHAMGVLDAYANDQISKSYQLLLMSVYHNNFLRNRVGFEKLFKELADKAWDDGIETIKHIAKRGGKMDFTARSKMNFTARSKYVETSELESLAIALDIEKDLALSAHRIHEHFSHANIKERYDPEIAHFMEKKFIEDQAGVVRKLAGYTNDLKNILKSAEKSLGLYLFDEYLQKEFGLNVKNINF